MDTKNELIEQLFSSAKNSLDFNLYDNAIFISEKLYSLDKSEKSLNLLATSYMRKGKPNIAYRLLSGSNTPPNKYLFAQACMLLGKFQQAENVLRGENEIFFCFFIFSIDLNNCDHSFHLFPSSYSNHKITIHSKT